MRLKDVECALSGLVRRFEKPKVELEQYPTSAHLASRIAFEAQSRFDDLREREVGDFGCGTGMLTCAAALMGATRVVGIDLDDDALDVARENVRALELEDAVRLRRQDLSATDREGDRFDTVLMNPPFGTRVKGIDMIFLVRAIRSCSRAVYSLHKTSTRVHVQKTAAKAGALGTVIATLRFDIPKMYVFHKEESVDVEVDLWRIVPNQDKDAIDRALEATARDLRIRRKAQEARRRDRGRGSSGTRGARDAANRSKRRNKGRRR